MKGEQDVCIGQFHMVLAWAPEDANFGGGLVMGMVRFLSVLASAAESFVPQRHWVGDKGWHNFFS